MAVSAKRQLQFWGIAFAVFVLVLWLLGATLLPFLLGAALAYFLDPLADRLERLGLNRVAATSVIAVGAVLVARAVRCVLGGAGADRAARRRWWRPRPTTSPA